MNPAQPALVVVATNIDQHAAYVLPLLGIAQHQIHRQNQVRDLLNFADHRIVRFKFASHQHIAEIAISDVYNAVEFSIHGRDLQQGESAFGELFLDVGVQKRDPGFFVRAFAVQRAFGRSIDETDPKERDRSAWLNLGSQGRTYHRNADAECDKNCSHGSKYCVCRNPGASIILRRFT